MNGIERKQLQIDRGTRLLVENIDGLRCKFGFSSILVNSPIVETRLRSGVIPQRPFVFTYELPDKNGTIQMSIPISFPDGQITVNIVDKNGNKLFLETLQSDIQGIDSLTEALELVLNLLTEHKEVEVPSASSPLLKPSDVAESAYFIEDDEALIEENLLYFTCRSCRFCLGDSTLLHAHSESHQLQCSSIFLKEAPSFLNSQEIAEGKLLCPKCSKKVGHWSWFGSKCSCGEWIVPSFQLSKSKIDTKQLL